MTDTPDGYAGAPGSAPAAPPQYGPAPGFYPDPGGEPRSRWWDGFRWTDSVTPLRPWRDARPFVPYVVTALALAALAHAAAFVAYRGRLHVAHRLAAGSSLSVLDAARSSDHDVRVAARVAVLSTLVTAVVWLLWFVRVYGSADTISPTRHRSWVVWGWIVPFVSLFRPPQMVAEVWTTADHGARRHTETARRPPLVALWWAAFLLAGFTAWFDFSDRAGVNASSGERVATLARGARLEMLSHALYVVTAVLAAVLAHRLTTRLHDRAVQEGRYVDGAGS